MKEKETKQKSNYSFGDTCVGVTNKGSKSQQGVSSKNPADTKTKQETSSGMIDERIKHSKILKFKIAVSQLELLKSHLADYFKNEKLELEKEKLKLDKQIHKFAPSNCPECGVKLSSYEAIDKHMKKYKHYGDYSKFDNKRPCDSGLVEDYHIIEAKLHQLNKDAKNILGGEV